MNDAPIPAANDAPLPVLRPRLPGADRLLPYLRRIDAARVYSNSGPLMQEFEARFAARLALPDLSVAAAGSGFSALVAAILAAAGRATDARPLALMPSYTFVASASAAEQCGFRPWLADVDASTWQLDPEALASHPEIARVGVVVPVAAYGRPVPLAGWRAFRDRTGIAVAIDGAACFDVVEADPAPFTGDIPLALSFHATKSFGCGEGGAVLCRDDELARRAATALNFGFYGARECLSANVNGKMDEYSAAVALAELDGWERKRDDLRSVAERYRSRFAAAGAGAGLHTTPSVSGAYVLCEAADAGHAARIVAALAAARIDYRRWYGLGLHAQPWYADVPRDALPVTADLAPRLIGLPFAPDLDDASIARVAAAVARA